MLFRSRSCERTLEDGWRLHAQSRGKPQELLCRALVVAVGRFGCSLVPMGPRTFLDRLIGVVGFVQDAGNGDDRTLIEACETGWWYCASLPRGRQVAAFMTDADLTETDRGRLDDIWQNALQRSIHARARVCGKTLLGPQEVVSASTYHRTRVAGERWVVAGDATFTFDPLSSQGIHKAVASGVAAAEVIASSITGAQDTLVEYANDAKRAFASYLEARAEYYRREARWPRSAFWRRRQFGQAMHPMTPG